MMDLVHHRTNKYLAEFTKAERDFRMAQIGCESVEKKTEGIDAENIKATQARAI